MTASLRVKLVSVMATVVLRLFIGLPISIILFGRTVRSLGVTFLGIRFIFVAPTNSPLVLFSGIIPALFVIIRIFVAVVVRVTSLIICLRALRGRFLLKTKL